jgi:hypothetical protein
VVATEQPHAVWIPHLECKQEHHNLTTVLAAVDEISDKHVFACARASGKQTNKKAERRSKKKNRAKEKKESRRKRWKSDERTEASPSAVAAFCRSLFKLFVSTAALD